jgi:acyl-coenzyme A synthetase/AMP-(fatty) acid ligase
VPDQFRFVSEIPKTATGKFSTVALRQLVGESGRDREAGTA